MLIRSEMYGVQGERPLPPVPVRFRLRRCPPCFLAGFCFLSAPEGRLGGLRLGTQGLREITRPLQRSDSSAPAKRNFRNDHRQQVRQGPRHHIRHHPARRRAVPRRHHDLRGEARGRRDARRHGRRRHRGRLPDHLRRRFPGGQRDRPPLQERRDRRPVPRQSEGHRPLRRSGEIRQARPRPHRDRDLAAAHARQAQHDAGAGDGDSRSPTSPARATRSTTSNGRPKTPPAARWTISAASSRP